MKEKVTIVELAKMAGVSTATVSRVINNTGQVDAEKRKLILNLIEEHHYRANYIAKALQSSKSNTVGFIVPHINSPYFAQLFFETELIAQKQGLTLMLCNSEGILDVESKLLNTLVSANVRAIVFMGGRVDDITLDEKYLKELENINKEVPLISCVEIPEFSGIQICENQVQSSEDLLKHLAETGRKEIALVGGMSHIRTTIQKRKEILDCAGKYGIHVQDEIIECGYSVDGGKQAMEEMKKWKKLPDAVICVNDLVAIGLLSEMQRNKIKVPEEVAIIGYDNMEVSQYIYPGITTLATDYKAYAQALVDTICKIDDIEDNYKMSLPRDLIIRGTTSL